jgi:hypothetical protein
MKNTKISASRGNDLLKKKTNEDHYRQEPNPKDPNQNGLKVINNKKMIQVGLFKDEKSKDKSISVENNIKAINSRIDAAKEIVVGSQKTLPKRKGEKVF